MRDFVFHSKARAQRIIPLCLCTILVAFPLAAQAQSNDVLNRIKRLENELDTLNRAVYKGEKPPAGMMAPSDDSGNATVRLDQLESDLRTLTGKVEQQSYDMQQAQQKLDALSQDSQMRLDAIEAQLRAAPPAAQVPPPPATQGVPPVVAPSQPIPTETPNMPLANPAAAPAPDVTGNETGGEAVDAASLYEKGFAEIKSEDYPAAEKTFAAFMKQYPKHSLAPNALYWLGETYYVRKEYDKAARVFAEAYQKYPNGPKGADNLLKLAMSLAGKGEKDNACIALGQLKKEYPKGPDPVLKRGEQEAATLGCK